MDLEKLLTLGYGTNSLNAFNEIFGQPAKADASKTLGEANGNDGSHGAGHGRPMEIESTNTY